MPGPIRDSQLRSVIQGLPQREQKLDDNNVLKLLSAVGDKNTETADTLLQKLQEPGLTRRQQFDLAHAGLDQEERADLEALLRDSELSLSPGARNFMEALTGASELGENHGPLVLQGAQTERIQGTAQAGDIIEVVNVSENPEAVYNTDAMEIRADEWGKFQGAMPGVEKGDVLRVRTRSANGNVSNWISLQAAGPGEDTRNAKVWPDALGLEINAQGTIDSIYLGDGMLSEPGAQLRMTNQRTGQQFDFTLDDKGQLPADTGLKGQAGDQFSIAVSDGVNNKDFSEVAGVTKVEGEAVVALQDPVLRDKHIDSSGKPSYKVERFSGPLFIDDAKATDVKQGNIANCYFAASASAVAHTDPDKLQNMMKDNGDGTYTVTFNVETYSGSGRFKKKSVTVDGDLYVNSSGGSPLYGQANENGRSHTESELWYPILEKAYAKLHGNSYEEIGSGGRSGDVLSALLGAPSSYKSVTDTNVESVYRQLSEAQEKGWPVTASTYGKDGPEAERYAGSKLYAWHAYSVLGVEEKDGKKFVQIRNPWGNTEPGYDGKNDGVFLLEIDKFAHFYKGVYIGKG